MKRWAIAIVVALSFECCALSPVRLFQAKVPAPLAKGEEQVEAERGAADLIARELKAPLELVPVANKLSVSLGPPRKPFNLPTVAQNATAASNALEKGIMDMNRKLDLLNSRLAKYEGKEIEGTGFSILGPGITILVIGLIALGVIFPPVFTLLAFAYRRLKATASMVVEEIDQTAKSEEAKEVVKKIKDGLNAKMDKSHKQVIHALQKP